MATYKEIFGKQVKFLSSDPANEATGQIWYNSTSGTFKSVLVSEAWSSASPITTTRSTQGSTSSGTQDAAAIFGGYLGPPGVTNLTEEYNGSGWSSGGNLGTSRYYVGGAGTLAAGLAFAGGAGVPGGPVMTGATEEYDGSSWTAGGTMVPAKLYQGTGTGTQTAAMCFGGTTVPYPASPAGTNTVEEYNGASWTDSPAMPRTNRNQIGFGTTSAAVSCGGNDYTTTTDEWNGTGWSAGGTMLSAREAGNAMGTQTLAIMTGGGNPVTYVLDTTNKYDGTTWTTLPALGSATRFMGGAGTTTAAIIGGGYIGPAGPETNVSQEFNATANVITAGAWASGGALGTTRYQCGTETTGTKTAGLIAGGRGSIPPGNPAYLWVETEEYDGTSWSPGGNIPNSTDMGAMFGTQTAAVLFGGNVQPGGPNPAPGSSVSDQTILYNGASWTAAPVYPATVVSSGGAGTQTAGLGVGGPPALTVCNEFNGAGWTLAGALTTGRSNAQCFGSQVAAGVVSGWPVLLVTEEYNGTSWTAGGDALAANEQGGSSGTQTDALLFGGNVSPTVLVQGYDGTAWSTRPSIATARYGGASAGAQTDGSYLAGGGGGPPTRQLTEEFTPEASALNYKTITTS